MKNKITFGIDFGTSNSAISACINGVSEVVSLEASGQKSDKSVIFFPRSGEGQRYLIGQEAILAYVRSGMDGRLMRSIKTVMKMVEFEETNVFGIKYGPVEMVSLILKRLLQKAELKYGVSINRAVVGRPVYFHEDPRRDRFVEKRLKMAAELAGLKEIEFLHEPVAAAYYYDSTLQEDKTVLVADFGAGTTDVCVLKVGPTFRGLGQEERVLATKGVYLGGDDFDRSLFWDYVTPYLGRGARFRSTPKQILDVPNVVFHHMLDWEHLSRFLNNVEKEALRQFYASALPEFKDSLARLLRVLAENQVYSMYLAVEKLKIFLSENDEGVLSYRSDDVKGRHQVDINLQELVGASEFEASIRDHLKSMQQCVDEAVSESGLKHAQIDRVFITGGSSLVPSVRRIFSDRFDESIIDKTNNFNAVAQGLALYSSERF